MKDTFIVTVWEETNWVVVRCSEPDVTGQGFTRKEALDNLREALKAHFDYLEATAVPKIRTISRLTQRRVGGYNLLSRPQHHLNDAFLQGLSQLGGQVQPFVVAHRAHEGHSKYPAHPEVEHGGRDQTCGASLQDLQRHRFVEEAAGFQALNRN